MSELDLCKQTTCIAKDQCHDVGTCDRTTGKCDDPIKPNDTSCGDDDVCTRDDKCIDGVCTAGLNKCCGPDKHGRFGICVGNCGNQFAVVQQFFGLPVTSQNDVTAAIQGGKLCDGTDVCCVPRNY